MSLVVLSVLVIALMTAVLAIYLFATGALLSRIASHLDDCLQGLKTIGMQASVVGPGVLRLNRIGRDVVGALPLLYGGAERLAGKSPDTASPDTAAVVPTVGYLDV
ncbi:MAG TPA: hypothetical protein VGJ13_12610 [Pseudonocardiaceae bacterium]|jgi:hypothetical protein